MNEVDDLYKTLQIDPSADLDVVQAAYRRLAFRYHPDRNRSPEAAKMMQRLNYAYEILSDSERRAAYDRNRPVRTFSNQENASRSYSQPSQTGFQYSAEPANPASDAPSQANPIQSPLFWLRWLAVLPAGLLGAIIVTFPIHWLVLIVTAGDDRGIGLSSLPPETLERLAVAFTTPFSIIYFAAWTAPTYKFHTGIAASIIIAAVLGGIYTLGFTKDLFYYSGLGWVQFAAVVALNFSGLASSLLAVSKRFS